MSVLSVGLSPSSALLSFVLAKSLAVTAVWPINYKSRQPPGVQVCSDRLGSSLFEPKLVYDLSRSLSIVQAPQPVPCSNPDYKTLDPESSSISPTDSISPATSSTTGKFDLVLLSLSGCDYDLCLEQLDHVIDQTTLVLVDCTGGFMPLRDLASRRFRDFVATKRCAVHTILCEAPVCQSPPIDAPTLHYGFQVLHLGPDATLMVSSSSVLDDSAPHAFLDTLLAALAPCDVQVLAPQALYKAQWERTLAFLSLQPLAITLDCPSVTALTSMAMAKPLSAGLCAELHRLARKCSGDNRFLHHVTPTYFLDRHICATPTGNNHRLLDGNSSAVSTASSSQSSLSSSSSSLPPLHSSPLMYYNFYHRVPLALDLHLLEPIVRSNEFGYNTPHLNSVYATLCALVRVNAGQGSLFRRADDATSQQFPTKLIQAIQAREDAVLKREQAVLRREQVVAARERDPYRPNELNGYELNGLSGLNGYELNAQRANDYEPNAQRTNGQRLNQPGPQRHSAHMQRVSGSNGLNGYAPNGSGLNGYAPNAYEPNAPTRHNGTYNPPDIDMMSMTARRRSHRLSRNSSQVNLDGTPSPSSSMVFPQPYTAPAQPFSQQLDLDDMLSMAHTRYGSVSRRSSVSARPMERSNSVLSISRYR